MAQTQTQTHGIEIRPGEIVSLGDRIVWCTLTPSNAGTNVCTIVYTPIQIDNSWIERAKERKDPIYLSMGFYATMSKEADRELRSRVKPFTIRLVRQGYASVLQYYDLYEMKIPLWRRILAIFKPIVVYGYRWSTKEERIEMAKIEFRGLSLKPRIVEKRWL